LKDRMRSRGPRVPHRPAVGEREVEMNQIGEASLEPPLDIPRGDVMPALADPLPDPLKTGVDGRDEEVVNLDLETRAAGLLEKGRLRVAGQGGLPAERAP